MFRASSYEPGNQAVHFVNFSPVDRDAIQETKPKWWNINLYPLWLWCDYCTCQAKIIPLLPLCCHGEAILSKKTFVPGIRDGKIFIPITDISVATSAISVTGAAWLLIWRNRIFFRRKERRGEILAETEPGAQLPRLWTVRVRVEKAVKMQSRPSWNNFKLLLLLGNTCHSVDQLTNTLQVEKWWWHSIVPDITVSLPWQYAN